ncbi:MAG: aminotransferase [Pseudomonadota bacterium]
MHFNQHVVKTEFPPVTEAANWVAGREFPHNLPLIDVSQAVPGYATANEVLASMAETLQQQQISKYGHALGLPELRSTYAATLHDNVHTDQVAITSGCNQAFYIAATALCEPGDNMILPLPWYFNHKMTLDMLGVGTTPLPCDPDNQLLPDPVVAADLIDSRTRAIVLISPNNPTGQVYPPELIDAFYQLAANAGIALIVDETYCDFRLENSRPTHHIFDQADWFEHAIHLYSFSKAYALAGYRVGALVGSAELQREVTKVIDCLAICASQLSQHAALCGMTQATAWREDKRTLMYQRATAFEQAMEGHDYQLAAIGAYFAYLKHPYPKSSTEVAKFLADEANLLCLPGDMFGPGQGQFMRVAFANVAEDKMPEISRRLAEFTV